LALEAQLFNGVSLDYQGQTASPSSQSAALFAKSIVKLVDNPKTADDEGVVLKPRLRRGRLEITRFEQTPVARRPISYKIPGPHGRGQRPKIRSLTRFRESTGRAKVGARRTTLFEAVGKQNNLPAGMAVWGPNILFVAVGLYLNFVRYRLQ
jgi:hypothetical protein